MNEPININEASFEKAVINSPVPVLVDFWAPWCGPCRMIAPVLDELAREGAGQFRIAKVNTDDEPALMQRFGIRGIPALLFFSGGELRQSDRGAHRQEGDRRKTRGARDRHSRGLSPTTNQSSQPTRT